MRMIRITILALAILCLVSFSCAFSQERIVHSLQDVALTKSLLLYKKGEFDKALTIVKEFEYAPHAYVIRGMIYFRKDKYENAVREIGIVKDWLNDVYRKLKNRKEKTGEEEVLKFIYFRGHLALGKAHFSLKNYEPAAISLAIFAEHHQPVDPNESARLYGYAGYAYYRVKDYDESIKNMKLSFKLVSDINKGDKEYEFRQEIAYNIAALFAIKRNVDNSIKWLRIPLVDDPQRLLSDIKNDEDFEPIRKNKKFNEFLDKYRASSKN